MLGLCTYLGKWENLRGSFGTITLNEVEFDDFCLFFRPPNLVPFFAYKKKTGVFISQL